MLNIEGSGSSLWAVVQHLGSKYLLSNVSYYIGSGWLFADITHMAAGVDLSAALMDAVDAGIAVDEKVLVQVESLNDSFAPYQLGRSPGVGHCMLIGFCS
jgi:hypothetical protein